MFFSCIVYLYRYNTGMNSPTESLLQQRAAVLQEMQTIDRLRRGSLSQQFFASGRGQRKSKRGPYYVLQGFFHGKKFSQRIPSAQAAQVQQQVHNYQRFQKLAEDYVSLTDQLTQRESPAPDRKKNSSPEKSKTNASGKPTPS
jgi:hypothetical protein